MAVTNALSSEEVRAGAPAEPVAPHPAVAMRGVTKSFGELVANEGVDFDLRAGEIHALLGENGAGKTTLMSILAGLLAPDAGAIDVDGRTVGFRSPRDALRQGIGMVQQHSVLVPGLSVADNLVLGRESSWRPRLRRTAVERWAAALCEEHETPLDVRAPVGSLPVDQVQQVEILRLLGRGVRILILDEPTAVLAQARVEGLFRALAALRDRSCAVAIVTHKLSEVVQLADRATVLRHGRVVEAVERRDFDEDGLAAAVMGGRHRAADDTPSGTASRRTVPPSSGPVLQIEDLVVAGERHAHAVDGLSLSVRAGEVLGLAGVEGNGQSELVEALAGVRAAAGGRIALGGEALRRIEPRELDRLGVGVVSADRLRWDVLPELSVAENVLLSELVDPRRGYARFGFLRRSRRDREAAARIAGLAVRPADPGRAVATLSGGNQQRLVLARELAGEPRLVVAAHPTRGLDIASVEFVHSELLRLRARGTAILLVTADRDELFALSDRVGVLFRGSLAYEAPAATVDQRAFGRAMVGLDGAAGPREVPA